MTTQLTKPQTLQLEDAERRLCEAARDATPLKLRSDERIRAEVIRRLLLGLPLPDGPYGLKPTGIRLTGGTINGRLDLDNAVMPEGGPIAALQLAKCTFDGGFSGAHGHFSRICFSGSRFRGATAYEGDKPLPTINLCGAALESDLSLRNVRPTAGSDLWISAIGARIDGQIDLSRSHLRAPSILPDRLMSEPAVNALDISLAQVNGDFQFLNGGRSEGLISARRAVIRGDVWMSGARIEAYGSMALFFQSAEIGGVMMLDGRADDAAGRGDLRRLQVRGQINLNDLQLGGSLSLSNVDLRPPKAHSPARIRAGKGARKARVPERPDPSKHICLRLDEARIGDSVEIDISGSERSRLQGRIVLDTMEVKNALTISDAYLGTPVKDPLATVAIRARFITARQVTIANVEPLLWEGGSAQSRSEMMALSVDMEGARIESLSVSDVWLNGRFEAASLKCAGDVTLDARVGGGVDLTAAEISGSLDISELRLDPNAEGINLQEAKVAQTLRLTHARLAARAGPVRLIRARRAALGSLPSMELMECLWRCDTGADRSQFFQTGFLIRDERPFLLDGKQATFDSLIAHFGHSITDRERAVEYVRLHCAYVRLDGKPRIMITASEGLPPFLKRNVSPNAAPGPAPAVQAGLEGLEAKLLAPRGVRNKKPKGQYTISGYCLHGDRLLRAEFRLSSRAEPVKIKLISDKLVRQVGGVPRASRQFVCHPEGIEPGQPAKWITPAAVAGMQDVAERDLAELDAKLAHHVRTSCALYGCADLTGLVCGMLDDNSGRCWGADVMIPMNHFLYSRTTWIGADAEDRTPFLKALKRDLWVETARRLPLPLVRLFNLSPRLRRASSYCSGWQARLNWIYRQFDTNGLPMTSRYTITQARYSPQPLEQAIKVCRAEGREDYAIQFEIEKQKIEWKLSNRRHRLWLIALGFVAAAVWLALTSTDAENRIGIAVVLVLGIASISYAANFAMRYMFGYLRRPVRAIASLVAAFLLGWGGVHLANERHLMVIDLAPVAAVAGPDQNRIRLGSQSGTALPIHDVHCGDTISEGLYALDVLIPLLDLREESRCEVGTANDVATAGPIKPRWVATLFGPTIQSERFWVAAKALYAIAGWFIVSLSILTFAHIHRARSASE